MLNRKRANSFSRPIINSCSIFSAAFLRIQLNHDFHAPKSSFNFKRHNSLVQINYIQANNEGINNRN